MWEGNHVCWIDMWSVKEDRLCKVWVTSSLHHMYDLVEKSGTFKQFGINPAEHLPFDLCSC